MAAGLFGDFPLSEDHKAWREDAAFLADYKTLSPLNPYSQDRKWTLREYTRQTDALSGDMAECGCYEGASAFFMLQASSHGTLYLFDSFQGLSEPDDQDLQGKTGVRNWEAGDLNSSEQTLRRNLNAYDRFVVLPGWIPARFAYVSERRFRLVHIDVDLYQPTKDSLEFFYPRMVEGGAIVIDDYGFLTCPGARTAADEFAASVGKRMLHLPTGQGVLMR
ncbi:MAG TPA: TylF/MycF/NovP-related O-methyltransferase [Luteimonas sp.]|nr:TylF/MycF/NovP-related O-methyltransferase [Luteimonas sp.]